MTHIIQEHFVGFLCTIILGAISGMLGYAFKMLKGLVSLSLATGYDKLYRYAEFYILTNQITVEEKKNLERIYNGYHALGGNGTGTELFYKCQELPMVEYRTVWESKHIKPM